MRHGERPDGCTGSAAPRRSSLARVAPSGTANCWGIEPRVGTGFVSKCPAMKAQNRSLLHHSVRLAFLDDIDDEQLERLAPDFGAHVPLPYRFEDEISWFIDNAAASL